MRWKDLAVIQLKEVSDFVTSTLFLLRCVLEATRKSVHIKTISHIKNGTYELSSFCFIYEGSIESKWLNIQGREQARASF